MKIGEALPSLIVAVLGVASAWLFYTERSWVMFIVLGVLLATGLIVSWYGRRHLLPNSPVTAVRLMEARILVPFAFAALASGIAIILAVAFEPEPAKNWDLETKKLMAATAAALTAFLTAGFIKSVEEADNNWVGEYAKDAFYNSYKRRKAGQNEERVRYFDAGSDGEMYVYADDFKSIKGWGRGARHDRARGVSEALREPAG